VDGADIADGAAVAGDDGEDAGEDAYLVDVLDAEGAGEVGDLGLARHELIIDVR
jgi:hypothetical protein